MKSTVESLSPTKVKLIVEVPFEELKPSLDAAYKSIGQQIVVPGFRKGKIPPQVIDQRVGRARFSKRPSTTRCRSCTRRRSRTTR